MILLFPVSILKASDHRNEKYLKGWMINRGDRFSIEYTHSIQLTPVIETYYIDEDFQIVLEESYFHSYGAGLPSDTPYSFEITKKGFRIYKIDEIMDNLVYRTGAIKANHKIDIKGKTFLFLDFSEPRTGVKFGVQKLPLILYIIEEVRDVKK